LPNWWRWIFYATIVWAIGYCIAYPAIPLVSSFTEGVLGYSSRANVAKEVEEARAAQAHHIEQLRGTSLEQIRTDSDLLEFALAGGRSAFNVNCSQCHGSGAQGFAGYPNLNDDEWLWGGTLNQIEYTIRHGIRNDVDEDAHVSEMPAFLTDEIMSHDEIADVTQHVMQLSGQQHDASASLRGEVLFVEQCAACHGDGGVGDQELGAPALNNGLWLYGGDVETVTETIALSRSGVMPAWGGILDDVAVKQLAIYVHSLGGGQ